MVGAFACGNRRKMARGSLTAFGMTWWVGRIGVRFGEVGIGGEERLALGGGKA